MKQRYQVSVIRPKIQHKHDHDGAASTHTAETHISGQCDEAFNTTQTWSWWCCINSYSWNTNIRAVWWGLRYNTNTIINSYNWNTNIRAVWWGLKYDTNTIMIVMYCINSFSWKRNISTYCGHTCRISYFIIEANVEICFSEILKVKFFFQDTFLKEITCTCKWFSEKDPRRHLYKSTMVYSYRPFNDQMSSYSVLRNVLKKLWN